MAAASKRPTHAAGGAEGLRGGSRGGRAGAASTSKTTVGDMAKDGGKSVGSKQHKREGAAERHCGSPTQSWRKRELGGLSFASLTLMLC